MVTDATKKLREPVAYILLAFAGLVALASLIRLFVGDAGFTAAAGSVQGTLTPPGLTGLVLLISLAGAVWLVADAGERTPNARTVTLAALVILGVILLIGLITAFAGFSETTSAGLKIVGFIYALGGLSLFAAGGLYIFNTYQALPAPVRAPKPGQQGQFAGQNQYGGQYGGQGGQYGQQEQYGQYGQQQYGQSGQGQYGAYGAGAAAGAAGGYAVGQGEHQQWPQEQGWNQGEQQQAWSAGEAETRQPEQQAWSSEGAHAAEPTQAWSAEGQQWGGGDVGQEQPQQWPQEQQWGSGDAAQQQWSGQDQYGQQSQPEWPSQAEQTPAPEPQSEHDWSQPEQTWSTQGESAWQEQGAPQPEESQPVEPQPAPEAIDETRVDPGLPETDKDEKSPQQENQNDQQGWWSQPS